MKSGRLLGLVVFLFVVSLGASIKTAQAATYYIRFSVLGIGVCGNTFWAFPAEATWNVPSATVSVHIVERAGGTTITDHTFTTGYSGSGTVDAGVEPLGSFTLSQPYTYEAVWEFTANGSLIARAIVTVHCTGGIATATISGGSAGNGGLFGGPALPEQRNLVLIGADTSVYDEPGGRPLETGQNLKACQTAYIIGTSKDGAWGQLFVMGGWIPLSATTDVAENYGQPGGQSTLPQCVGK